MSTSAGIPQSDNTKLLRTITTMRSVYSVDDLERRHVEESVLVNRISNFRGPETARCAASCLGLNDQSVLYSSCAGQSGSSR